MKYNSLFLIILVFIFSACDIEEIPRIPILTSPLGLQVKLAPAVATTPPAPPAPRQGLVIVFTANNPEIYFTGFSVFVSTRREDFQAFADSNQRFFPIVPTEVPGSQARLLTNYSPSLDTNLSIFVGGRLSFPVRYIYPTNAQFSNDSSIPEDNPEFRLTTFSSLPPGGPGVPGAEFEPGTRYFFAAYSYSSLDNSYSLPSNIEDIVFPNN